MSEGRIPADLRRLVIQRAGINDQWRICFRWAGGDASEVEISDYH